MTAPPIKPAQLKAYLGSAREYLAASSLPDVSNTTTPPLADQLSSLSSAYRSLLCLELAQRGVLAKGAPFEVGSSSSSNNGADSGDVGSILEGVTSTAGRALFDAESSSLPKPMMAACSAVMAMAAERCADVLDGILSSGAASVIKVGDLPTNLLLLSDSADASAKSSNSALEAAQRRCTDVNDVRLSSILSLSQLLRPQCKTPDSPPPKSSEIVVHLQHYRVVLLRIATGQYLRAAVEFSADDQPQMWKRCLDAVLRLNTADFDVSSDAVGGSGDDEYNQYATIEAALPLTNLIRIAGSKGNDRRASELSLRLAQSYLAGIGGEGGKVSQNAADSELRKLSAAVKDVFWSVYHRKTVDQSNDMYAGLAQEAMSIVKLPLILSTADLSDEEKKRMQLLYCVMSLQSKLAVEQGRIDELADENWVAAKNRAEEKSGGVGRGGIVGLAKSKKQKAMEEDLSRDRFVTEAKRNVLLGDNGTMDIDSAALSLRDEVISGLSNSAVLLASALSDAAFELLERQVRRLAERARSIALLLHKPKKKAARKWSQCDSDTAWASVASFVDPLLIGVEEHGEAAPLLSRMSKRARQAICAAAVRLVSASWMIVAEEEPAMQLDLAASILSQGKEINKSEEKEAIKGRKERGDDAIGAADVSKESDGSLLIDAALSAAQCRNGLALSGDNTNVSKCVRNATVDALRWERKITSRSQKELLGEVGAPFLQLLLSWSGLHRSPWSFCTVTQARSIVRYAKESLELSSTAWGRAPTSLELIILRLAQADVECQLPGGYVPEGEALYRAALSSLEDTDSGISGNVVSVLESHCLCGLSKIALTGVESVTTSKSADDYARECLDALAILSEDNTAADVTLFHWRGSNAFNSSVAFHICAARQLVAESMLRGSKQEDAYRFLEDAVRDAPFSYDAAFALGSFRLRMLLSQVSPSDTDRKMAQTQLLKAAKLNVKKADPFALLGLWYEVQNDGKRALGCHSKALILDPTHPVAGRGVLRMKSYKDIEHLCIAATSVTSPVNGWAWRAVGRGKAMGKGDDESAAICFQQALRCRDIQAHTNENLGFFFRDPTVRDRDGGGLGECGETWSDLAGCYRRLGKYSAALRAYTSADEVSSGGVPPDVLCAWAHVELELGLYDEAVAKFEAVLGGSESASLAVASYGHGTAMLALSRLHANEGKFGSALEHLQRGIKSVKSLVEAKGQPASLSSSACALKLLGDLYTFGSSLPASLFGKDEDDANDKLDCCHHDDNTVSKLSFASKGGEAYTKAWQTHKEREAKCDVSSDSSLLSAAALFDVGTSLLCQARILASSLGEGTGGGTKSSMLDMPSKCPGIRGRIDQCIEHFRKAIEMEETFAPAWCGLGSALCYKDTLLAQHCFCRALQIDKASPENWSNLGLVYADRGIVNASSEALDALTCVADTPFMWIGRALLLEDESVKVDESSLLVSEESSLSRASDAYRAALQVANHPVALLGLSLTARRLGLSQLMEEQNAMYSESAHLASKRESHLALSVHLHLTGPYNVGSTALDSIHRSEVARDRFANGDGTTGEETLDLPNVDDTAKLLEQLSLDCVEQDDSEELKSCNGGVAMATVLKQSNEAMGSVKSLAQTAASSSDVTATKEDASNGLASARLRARLHPDNGEYFLNFAKELAKEYTSLEEPPASSRAIVSSAAEKASALLLDQATNIRMIAPRRPITNTSEGKLAAGSSVEHDLSMHKNVVPKVVDADIVSESFALKAWLPVEEKEEDSECASASEVASVINIHRALLLDPENLLARGLLHGARKER